MIEILIVGVIVVAILGAFVLIVRWGMKAKDQTIAATDIISATRAELATSRHENDRLEFELKTTKDALTDSERRVGLLSKELADAMERSSLGAGLAANDIRGRVLRAAEAARARSAGDPVPASAGPAVPDAEAASGSATASLHVLDPIDVLR